MERYIDYSLVTATFVKTQYYFVVDIFYIFEVGKLTWAKFVALMILDELARFREMYL